MSFHSIKITSIFIQCCNAIVTLKTPLDTDKML